MTNQQKYSELLDKYCELEQTINAITNERTELRQDMAELAMTFPNSFYYKLEDRLLYRENKNYAIEVRTFDK